MAHPLAVAGFLVALLPLVAVPGASLTLLVRHVGHGGRRQAVPVVLGTATGLYAHAVLAAAGLSALVMHSSQAFTVVKLAGAAYLVGLGLWTWRSAGPAVPVTPAPPPRTGPVYAQALLANVLNPKAASVYLTLVPQFVTPDRPIGGQILTLATAHALLVAVWLTGWTVVIGRAARMLRRTRLVRALTRAAAVALVALGLRAAVA